MWLYRAYSGNLYHNGEQTLTLSSFTQGDFITCVLDMEARTISFGKNGEVGGTIRPKPVQAVFYLLHANTNCLKHINVCLHIQTLAQCDLRVLRLLIIAHFWLDRSLNWPLRTLMPQSSTPAWCSTAATLERRWDNIDVITGRKDPSIQCHDQLNVLPQLRSINTCLHWSFHCSNSLTWLSSWLSVVPASMLHLDGAESHDYIRSNVFSF